VLVALPATPAKLMIGGVRQSPPTEGKKERQGDSASDYCFKHVDRLNAAPAVNVPNLFCRTPEP
jgi:hypothetical protein